MLSFDLLVGKKLCWFINNMIMKKLRKEAFPFASHWKWYWFRGTSLWNVFQLPLLACLEDYIDSPTIYEVPNHKLYFQHSMWVQYDNKTSQRNLSHTHTHTDTHTHIYIYMNISVLGQLFNSLTNKSKCLLLTKCLF